MSDPACWPDHNNKMTTIHRMWRILKLYWRKLQRKCGIQKLEELDKWYEEEYINKYEPSNTYHRTPIDHSFDFNNTRTRILAPATKSMSEGQVFKERARNCMKETHTIYDTNINVETETQETWPKSL